MLTQRNRWRWALVGLLLVAGCRRAAPPPPAAPTVEPPPATTGLARLDGVSAYGAAAFTSRAVTAKLTERDVDDDLSNVANLGKFAFLGPEHRRRLAADGFIVVAAGDDRLADVYQRNAAEGVPSLITVDLAMALFDAVLDEVEARLTEERLAAPLTNLVLALIDRTRAQVDQVPGAEMADAARRNLAWLTVAADLLGLDVEVDDEARHLGAAEFERLTAGAPPSSGGLFPYRLPALPDVAGLPERAQRAERAIAWLSLPLATRTAPRREADPVRPLQMLLLSHALAAEPGAPLAPWRAVAETRAWFRGAPAGPTMIDVLAVADEIFGADRTLRSYDDGTRVRAFTVALEERLAATIPAPPAADGEPDGVSVGLFDPPEPWDADVLAALARANGRAAAGGLELFAALDQPRASELIADRYRLTRRQPDYATELQRLRDRLTAVPAERWRADLVRGRLWAAVPTAATVDAGWPRFQRSPAWRDKSLMTALTTWAAARSQPAEVAPAEPWVSPETAPPAGFVETCPETFDRLRWLTRATSDGLAAHDLLDPAAESALDALEDLLGFLADEAVGELGGRPRSPEATDRLRRIADEATWLPRADRDALPTAGSLSGLHLGRGGGLVIYAVVPLDGKPVLTRGLLTGYWEADGPADPLAAPLPAWAEFIQPNPRAGGLPAPTGAPYPGG